MSYYVGVYFSDQICVLMEKCGSQVVAALPLEGSKCASTVLGEPSVMMLGMTVMQK